jgi:acyl carrier protein
MNPCAKDSDPQHVADRLRVVVAQALGLSPLQDDLRDETPMLGAIPELDSIGALAIIVGIEDSFGVPVSEERLTAETFATFGSLRRFVADRIEHGNSHASI